MRTIVYIDGFNLYYRALKHTPYKWLDVEALCRLLLPKNEILRIKYFTARVNARPNDPDQPLRQETYLKALAANPLIDIIYGHFLSSVVTMPLADPQPGTNSTVRVMKTEEKGSDVNIACHMLWDTFSDQCDVVALISNDSDLICPLDIVRNQLGKSIAILNPSSNHQSVTLRNIAHFWKGIRQTHLAQCQLPNPVITVEPRSIFKPHSW